MILFIMVIVIVFIVFYVRLIYIMRYKDEGPSVVQIYESTCWNCKLIDRSRVF